MRPLADMLLVRPDSEKAATNVSGLLVVQNEKQRPDTGEVLAVGPEVTAVQVGERVLFSKYAGLEYEDGDDKLLVLKITDVVGVIETKEGSADAGRS